MREACRSSAGGGFELLESYIENTQTWPQEIGYILEPPPAMLRKLHIAHSFEKDTPKLEGEGKRGWGKLEVLGS
ncbi:Hypothetical protein NTJ_13057 [Nesidiocoris tenuis]|uniref:Uncharacterized protein n=1 Tax=Nesidiocoris tenuis TaxID=355587 RepID=A0ABN7B769_9HEMI|nr:Hypothetical protein NTJ_13057 [Nesidiocoris tenuis]